MKGRKPAPPELKIARGERPDRLNADAPTAPRGAPEKPTILDGYSAEEWDRITGELGELGVLARTDRAAITLYCLTYGRYRDALDEVESYGLTSTTASGGTKTSAHVGVLERAEATMIKLLSEFGLTPTARNRVSARPEKQESKLSSFLGRAK